MLMVSSLSVELGCDRTDRTHVLTAPIKTCDGKVTLQSAPLPSCLLPKGSVRLPSYASSGALLLLAMFALVAPVAAQDSGPTRNAFFVELFGNALYGSLNYERALAPNLSARVGLGPLGPTGTLMLSYLSGTGSHRLETGGGLLLRAGSSNVLGTATMGYRYQRPTGGPLFRAGFTPLVGGGGVAPWFGISFGVGF